ncbi:MarR family winged helix-turn-helix transcriptional regulator [Aliiroseovarius crassostreae]|uniref:MarR family winged helix-turn-helix transcriptional regulator n=1 Tax=Aliiroseovarius crassostreae TaxID=154981 RepID=UPI003C7E916C
MASCTEEQLHLQHADPNLEPEFRAFMGMFALHSFLENQLSDCGPGKDLTKQQSGILVRLGQPKRLGELARDTNSLPSTMTAAADQMERMGLVVRQRDPNDRRAWLLVLTDEGQAMRKEFIRMSRVMFQDLLKLSDDELAMLAQIGTKLHTNIQLAIQNPDLITDLIQAQQEGQPA